MLGIYVHLPFCPYICPYCDFAKWPHRRSDAHAYLSALYAELRSLRSEPAATIFLGGGTPNTYEACDVAQLIAALRDRFPVPSGRSHEITVELNPELVRGGDFAVYAEAGVDRISLGVQSFDEGEARTLGRKHTPQDVARAVAQAKSVPLRSVSLDLIFAVPGQSARTWRESLERAVALDVDHISTYGLTVEAGTPYETWREREPQAFFDDAREAELYGIAIETLEAAGYEQYEISNFGRPGHRCAHNENYWANGEYLGLGVGAASYRDGVRSTHTRDRTAYQKAALEGGVIPGESERLTGARRAGEAVMLALRTAQGVPLRAFKDRYGLDFLSFYSPVVARYVEDGLLQIDSAHVRLTTRGRFLANEVCAAFVTFA